MVYLRFITDTHSLESRIIRFGSRWWCSHVEFIEEFPSGTLITLGSRLKDGVQFRHADYCKPTREEWWTATGIDAAYNKAILPLGEKYDWKDILGFAFARDWHQSNRYICSELVDWAFKQVGAPLTNIWMPSHRVSPRDLLVSPAVSFVRRVV